MKVGDSHEANPSPVEMGEMKMGNMSKLEPMKGGPFEKSGIDPRPIKLYWEKDEEK